MSSHRHQSREAALQILFQSEFDPQLSLEQLITKFSHSFELPEKTKDYTSILIQGVLNHRQELDNQLSPLADHWSLDRMALVDKIILRIASFEMLFSDQPPPPKVIINEAIELAKKYSTEESASFVNGILDKLMSATLQKS